MAEDSKPNDDNEMARHKILIVDDEAPNLRLLKRVLGDEHEVLAADGADEALKILAESEVSLIISDQRMPGMNGVQLLEKSQALRPDAIKILITGYTDVQALIDAINLGQVYKYISKPWDADELRLTVRRALETYELQESNVKLLSDLQAALAQLEELSMGTICALANALDAKCDYTSGHSIRVSRIAVALGKSMELSIDELKDIELAGILHDIGKIGVPESVLWKSARLTDEEQAIMSHHPVRSAQIIGGLKGLSRAREYVLHHHEFMDGSGYPDHLKGDQIPLGSRIILVADAYDAMTTDRPYRKAIGHGRALEELRRNAGWQFDHEVVGALALMAGQEGELLDQVLSESVLGLSITAIDPKQIGTQYRLEAERQSELSAAG